MCRFMPGRNSAARLSKMTLCGRNEFPHVSTAKLNEIQLKRYANYDVTVRHSLALLANQRSSNHSSRDFTDQSSRVPHSNVTSYRGMVRADAFPSGHCSGLIPLSQIKHEISLNNFSPLASGSMVLMSPMTSKGLVSSRTEASKKMVQRLKEVASMITEHKMNLGIMLYPEKVSPHRPWVASSHQSSLTRIQSRNRET